MLRFFVTLLFIAAVGALIIAAWAEDEDRRGKR